MKTKIVYVLVSTEKDCYLEQAYVSMTSLRQHMPDVSITLLVDTKTKNSFVGERAKMASLASDIISIDLDPNIAANKRSRLLKTSARLHISGDYLFIDTDTIIARDLSNIDDTNTDIAACWDSHSPFKTNPYRDMCISHGKRLNWPIENEESYFNSGVIFVKDSPQAHEFYKKWHQNYLEGTEKRVFMDQPSFAKTNYEMGHIVKTLPDVWNCELKHGIRFLRDAYIVHYLCTNKEGGEAFLLNNLDVFEKIKETGELPEEVIKTINDPFCGLPNVSWLRSIDDLTRHQNRCSQMLESILNRPKLFRTLEKILVVRAKIKHR